MAVLKTILTVLYVLVCLALIVVVVMQESKAEGLSGALTGGNSQSYWGKNKGRSVEGLLVKLTILFGALFIVLSIVLQLRFWP
ncbi:MAG: preprotein translocase subunit SecG [Lachnospiraceae bacterium]|nr:preprotein translocase subunit SecG [Lachnospiraceae bacterium]